MASVRYFVSAFCARFQRLDVLINNAGNFDLSKKIPIRTSEGFETIWVTNYLGPWLLSSLLLPLLKSSAPARIINVGSKGLLVYPFLNIEFDNLDGSKKLQPPASLLPFKVSLPHAHLGVVQTPKRQ